MAHTIRIDWDELEIALMMNLEEQKNYLDLGTGQVEMAANDFTGTDVGLSEEEVEAGFSEGYLIRIEPLSSSVEYGWMADFAETVADRRLREILALAPNGRGAFRRFKDILSEYPAERERWFAFRDERLRREIKEWLADHDIEPDVPPSEKKS
jgi:hypothetical protein